MIGNIRLFLIPRNGSFRFSIYNLFGPRYSFEELWRHQGVPGWGGCVAEKLGPCRTGNKAHISEAGELTEPRLDMAIH